jgi:hypothetical protein
LMPLVYETGGLWRGAVWGHPVWLLAYEDATVEVDSIPLYLMGDEADTPRELATLVLQDEGLLRRFAEWFNALQPTLFKEIRQMAERMTDGPRLNWKAIGETTDLLQVLDAIPPEEIIKRLGLEVAVETMGAERILATQAAKKLVDVIKNRLTKEELQAMLRERDQK